MICYPVLRHGAIYGTSLCDSHGINPLRTVGLIFYPMLPHGAINGASLCGYFRTFVYL
ncbi:MAG: hypothetical protein J4G05_10140 [Chlorobi bacterium]|nr:hypothetical protein [Chlorobiota bacterium]